MTTFVLPLAPVRVSRVPARRLLVSATVVNAIGTGAYVPVALVLLTSLTGLGLGTVGMGLTLAQLAALPLMPVSGALIDRYGARRVQVTNQVLRATGFALYPLAHDLPTFLGLAVLVAAGDRCSRVAAPALAAAVMPAAERDRYVTLDRSLSNAGLGVGGVLAALLVGGGPAVFVATSVGAAGAFTVGALLTLAMQVPPVAPCRECTGGSYRTLWADRPFRSLVAANALSAFGYSALTMLVPLFAMRVLHTSAALGAGMFTINTVICAVASVPLMRHLRARGLQGTTIARLGLAGMTTGVAMVGLAAVFSGRPVLVGATLVAAIIVYSLGEVCHSPAATSLVLDRADDANRGRYLGVYQVAWALAFALSPLVFTSLIQAVPFAAIVGLVVLDLAAIRLLTIHGRAAAVRRSTTAPR